MLALGTKTRAVHRADECNRGVELATLSRFFVQAWAERGVKGRESGWERLILEGSRGAIEECYDPLEGPCGQLH